MSEAEPGFLERLRALGRHEVLVIGVLRAEIVALWAEETESNLLVVVTGERLRHYLERHKDVVPHLDKLPDMLIDPDEIHRNKEDAEIAIFYQQFDARKYLRGTIVLQRRSGEKQHSLTSYRIAMTKEVRKGQDSGRLLWRK